MYMYMYACMYMYKRIVLEKRIILGGFCRKVGGTLHWSLGSSFLILYYNCFLTFNDDYYQHFFNNSTYTRKASCGSRPRRAIEVSRQRISPLGDIPPGGGVKTP